jgi:hypothetical protein
VASFFSKYEGRDGFKTADWSADMLERLALVRAAKLLSGSDRTDGITGIRSARIIGFAPTTASARALSREGLRSEAADSVRRPASPRARDAGAAVRRLRQRRVLVVHLTPHLFVPLAAV